MKEILEAHRPPGGRLGKGHIGLYETITNSLHMQLGLALAALGVVTSLAAQHIYALNPYAFLSRDYATEAALYTHHQYIAGFLMVGAFAHGAIFFVRDYDPELNKGNVNTSRKIFEKLVPGVKANICCANTLQMTDEKLKNMDGTKRFAQASKLGTITINPPKSVDEFFNYFEGTEGGPTSEQKAKVLDKLADKGYTIDVIKSILDSTDKITNFLVLHEQDHINNNDIDVYWKNGKNLLTDDKVEIETRATIAALEKLGGIPKQTETLDNINTEDTEGSDNPTPCGIKS
jgi:hypothetical protein